ncbi:MAG: hypothetical protein ACYCZY_08380 [Lacisediminihabitans sp.]
MRKYIFSATMLSAVFSGWSAVQSTWRGPRDWRLVLMWISWGLAIAIAVGTVIKEADSASHELED